MIGLINLFVCVLQSPAASSAHSNVSLLDVAAGYFAHMDFVTAEELSFNFARDVAALTRRAAQRAQSAATAASRTDVNSATSPLVDAENFTQVSDVSLLYL